MEKNKNHYIKKESFKIKGAKFDRKKKKEKQTALCPSGLETWA